MSYTFKNGDRPLEGYTIQRGVGRGGFGEVYYAVSDGGREVALKYLRDNPEVELRGVSQCMNLKSPHLVTIFDVMKSNDGDYFVVMEYISGPSLRDLLLAHPKGLGPQKAAFFLREIGKGLSYLHDRGLVHRDLKPANVFYDDGYVKIVDYGLSKFISLSRHSAQTSSVGTVHYMAPEVGSGDYSRGIDIYALGVIFYEMLLGRVPYEGSSMGEVLMKHLTSQPEVDNLPSPFGEVIRKALAKDPKERYQTIEEMLADGFEGGDLRDRRVGFNPELSLAGAVRRQTPEFRVSPAPSPNPAVPPPPPPVPAYANGARATAGVAARQAAVAVPAGGAPVQGAYPAAAIAARAALSPEAATGYVRYAGFWIRFLAALIDTCIVGAVAGVLGEGPFVIVSILYQGILIGKWNGQTLGKKACGIKVISSDGRPCGVGQAFGRAAAKIISGLILFIGYLMIPFDDQKRGLHDHMARTLHVYAIQ